jgi:glycosyltransferase involved in cell wall biosynthesis
MSTITILIPLYNEERVFVELTKRIEQIVLTSQHEIRVILIDDGSSDSTSILMTEFALSNNWCSALFLSRNFGHQNAVSAGLENVENDSDFVFIIDGDLQDPPELYQNFYDKISEGYDVVYGIRRKRKENLFKKFLYWTFYRILQKLSDTKIPLDSGDFAMISKKVLSILNSMPEKNRFLRGMRSWVGYNQIGIEYEREPRRIGDSKYSFKMLFNLAYDGIFNFSSLPLRLMTTVGILIIVGAFFYLFYLLFNHFTTKSAPPGYVSMMAVLILFHGFVIFSLGIVGEYIFRIFVQVQNRPIYIVRNLIRNGTFHKEN